ncbi:MAG: HAMP domain-containing histidine kinase [Cyclobacteriaceae bacterium]
MLDYIHNQILQIGINDKLSDLLKRRIILTNTLNLTIQVFCLALMGFMLYYKLMPEFFVGVVAMTGTGLVYWLNYIGKYQASSLVLINVTSASIFAAAIIAFNYSILAEPENWLFAFITIAVFLLDGWLLISQFILIFVEIVIAKLYKYLMIEGDYGRDFVLLIVNTSVHCIGLYVFLIFIKKDHFKTQHKLEESNHTKNKLLSILAHDIRSPLANLKALLSLNDNGILKDDEFQKHKGTVNNKIGFLTEEIDDVVQWSVVQSKNLDPLVTTFDPKACVEKVVTMFSDLCLEKQIGIELISDVDEISLDENHFKLIIRNLLHNAIKFTPQNGSIEISIKSTQIESLIEITDTGIGMKSEVVSQLLAHGKTSSIDGTNGEKGAGLGLTMCLDLMERNHVNLDIESKIEEGSTFRLRVPKS